MEQQQNLRFPAAASKAPANGSTDAAPATTAAGSAEHHEELDELFDNLDLADSAPLISLRQLLLATDDDSLKKLEDVIADRTEEGFGETVFELGFENNSDSMQLTLDEWNKAYERLLLAAKGVKADCELLLTKYVGGDKEAASTADNKTVKDKSCSGKILIRHNPASIEDVIETRIAVVGNGEKTPAPNILRSADLGQSTPERAPCWESW